MVAIRKYRVHCIADFVHPAFHISNWQQCYAIPLRAPVNVEIPGAKCLPPPVKRVRGRPKGSRAKSQREVEDLFQRVRKCNNCGQPGHSAAQCEAQGNGRVIDAGGVYLDPHTGHLEI